jgi:hypothetical protein
MVAVVPGNQRGLGGVRAEPHDLEPKDALVSGGMGLATSPGMHSCEIGQSRTRTLTIVSSRAARSGRALPRPRRPGSAHRALDGSGGVSRASLVPAPEQWTGTDWRTIAGGIGGALFGQLDEEYPPACA